MQLALEQEQQAIDHLDGYLLAVVPPAAREGQDPNNAGLVMKFDPALLPEVVRMTRAAGTWMVPTQTLYENLFGSVASGRARGAARDPLRAAQAARAVRKFQAPDLRESECHGRLCAAATWTRADS